jgi:hypothetical protein
MCVAYKTIVSSVLIFSGYLIKLSVELLAIVNYLIKLSIRQSDVIIALRRSLYYRKKGGPEMTSNHSQYDRCGLPFGALIHEDPFSREKTRMHIVGGIKT